MAKKNAKKQTATIVVSFCGKGIRLSPKEAKSLYLALKEVYGENQTNVYLPYTSWASNSSNSFGNRFTIGGPDK